MEQTELKATVGTYSMCLVAVKVKVKVKMSSATSLFITKQKRDR